MKQSRSLRGHHRLYTVIPNLGNPYIISWRYKYMNKKRENTNIWKINYENKMSMFWPIITETGWVNINNGKYHFNNNTYTLILIYCKFLDKLIEWSILIFYMILMSCSIMGDNLSPRPYPEMAHQCKCKTVKSGHSINDPIMWQQSESERLS